MSAHRSLADAPQSWREELAATSRLAGPLVLASLGQSLITTTDVLMIGRLGPDPLAASALAVNLFMVVMLTGTGLAVATAPLIAAAIGARAHSLREARRSFRMGLWLCLFYSVVGSVLLWNAGAIFRLFGQDPDLSQQAEGFMRILMWSLFPALLVAAFRTLLTAFERTAVALIIILAGVAVNALLNWVLIYGYWGAPRLGLAGSALASLITNVAMAAALALAVARMRKFRRIHWFGRLFRSDWPRFRRLVSVGAPIAASWAFEVSVFSAAVFLMGLIDTTSVAAHTIALQIASLSFMVPLGLAQAVTIRIGMGYGAQDPEWIDRAGRVALALSMSFMSFAAAIIWLFPAQLAGLYLDLDRPDSAPVLALAVKFLLIAAIFQLADGAQVTAAAMLRGLQDTTVPMIYSGLGYWVVGVGVGAWLAFGAGWAGEGVWVGLAAGLLAVAVLLLARWSRRVKLGLVPARSAPNPH